MVENHSGNRSDHQNHAGNRPDTGTGDRCIFNQWFMRPVAGVAQTFFTRTICCCSMKTRKRTLARLVNQQDQAVSLYSSHTVRAVFPEMDRCQTKRRNVA
jgi:hypothetical protein